MKMKVGVGTSVMYRGSRLGNLDGIGYYTKNLCESLSLYNDRLVIEKLIFGNYTATTDEHVYNAPKYSRSALITAVSGRPFKVDAAFENKVDLFHATDHHTPKFKNIPVIATLMDAIPLSNPEWVTPKLRRLKNWVWRKSGTWADRIITISDYSKEQIAYHFNISESKISVVPLGVDKIYFEKVDEILKSQILKSLNIPNNFFLFVGTLQPRKNVERIIAAHEFLPLKLQREMPLIIVGDSGWSSEKIVSRLNRSASGDTVRWLSRVDDHTKRVLMQQAEAVLLPSLAEGFGLPVLEGFASETPVITSNLTALVEVAGDAAWLVDPYNVADISEAMLSLARDDKLAKEYAVKGLKRAQKYTWEECALKTIETYENLMTA